MYWKFRPPRGCPSSEVSLVISLLSICKARYLLNCTFKSHVILMTHATKGKQTVSNMRWGISPISRWSPAMPNGLCTRCEVQKHRGKESFFSYLHLALFKWTFTRGYVFREKEKNIDVRTLIGCLPYTLRLGVELATQVCVDQESTRNLLVFRTTVNQLSHPARANVPFLFTKDLITTYNKTRVIKL